MARSYWQELLAGAIGRSYGQELWAGRAFGRTVRRFPHPIALCLPLVTVPQVMLIGFLLNQL